MDLQLAAAQQLLEALAARHMSTVMAIRSDGCVVSVQEHPGASVYFKYDQLGGLLVEFVFDSRPPVRLDHSPTPAGAADLAEFVVQKVAGAGGGAAPTT
ncbi:hypothetical protein [Mycobacterium asiaticum]|uniref:hypothetical protein n=1 Tax=Mycobacterium asiaticum TaxID=1790 RepID=UPI0012DB0ECA|nr:hypothetical protein [Mycobacterium asiaticum]